jgi:hypothetical protein
MTIVEYLCRRTRLRNTHYVITAEGAFFIENGKHIPEREFEQQCETPISLITARGQRISEKRGEDIDGRNNWLNVR